MEEELVGFNNCCDEFVAGRFILPEAKFSAMLNTFSNNERLKNVISYALRGFDFDYAYEQMKNNPEFVYPTDEKEIIALVYNLLFRFENKTIRFADFLNKFFDNNLTNFSKQLILPFKEAINSAFSNKFVEAEQISIQNNCYLKIKTNIKLILNQMDDFKLKPAEKEEFAMLLNSLYIACDKFDKKFVYSIMIGLDYFSKCLKRTRNAYLSLEECFEK